MFKHILVPTDGSALSDSTVARAVSFAKETGARITFFYSQPDFPMPIYGEGALIDPTTPEQFAKSAASEAEAILSKARGAAEASERFMKTSELLSAASTVPLKSTGIRLKCWLFALATPNALT